MRKQRDGTAEGEAQSRRSALPIRYIFVTSLIGLALLLIVLVGGERATAENGRGGDRSQFDYSIWESVPIQEGGLEKSMRSFASSFVREVSGKSNYAGRNPIDNVFSMAFEGPEAWAEEPFLKLRLKDLKEIFDAPHNRISPIQLWEKQTQWFELIQDKILLENGTQLFGSITKETSSEIEFNHQGEAMTIDRSEITRIIPGSKEAEKELGHLIHKADLILGKEDPIHPVPSAGANLKIVPTADFRGEKDLWKTVDDLASKTKEMSAPEKQLVAAYGDVRQAFVNRDAVGFNLASAQVVAALDLLDVPTFKPVWKFKLDSWDSRIGLFRLAGWTYLLSSIIFLTSYLVGRRLFTIAAHASLGLGASLNIAALIIRGILAGRTPVANLYESAVFIIAAIATFSFFISLFYRNRVVGMGGATLGAFFMGIANSIPLHYGGKINPLIDALQSYWLRIHVTSMLISYSFFAIAFCVSVSYMGRYLLMRRRPGFVPAEDSLLKYLDNLNFRIITIGVPILTAGVILGAVWAAEAWGRPWAFDPKETAALITWMIYAFYLHARLFLGWRGFAGIFLSVVGFGAVVFTYLGVSFFLEGLHSYVSPGGDSFLDMIKKFIPGI